MTHVHSLRFETLEARQLLSMTHVAVVHAARRLRPHSYSTVRSPSTTTPTRLPRSGTPKAS